MTPAVSKSPARTNVDVVRMITDKRDGVELAAGDIDALIQGFVAGDIPDYQVSALLMAIVFRGLGMTETLALTRSMVESGARFDMSSLGRRIVDKHSTGGVGDKVSLVLAPIVAACGAPFGKMSGRGLGHTGGTLDKLESIKGYRVELDEPEFLDQVRRIGVAVAGQTSDIVPADRMLYALRDVTGTVESIPLIAASIMSKKLATGADAIVLDVKVGSGAFMKNLEHARQLADEMIAIGAGAGRDVQVLLTDMSTPLGCMVGNALELLEVQEVLHDRGPADLRELVFTAAGMLLSLSDLDLDEEQGTLRARNVVANGAAWKKYREWISAQGGDPDAPLPSAPVEHTVLAPSAGTIMRLDALTVGLAAARLGAGRQRKGDVIDRAVGIELHAQVGQKLAEGEPLLTVHANDEAQAYDAARAIEAATEIRPGSCPRIRESVILERRG